MSNEAQQHRHKMGVVVTSLQEVGVTSSPVARGEALGGRRTNSRAEEHFKGDCQFLMITS